MLGIGPLLRSGVQCTQENPAKPVSTACMADLLGGQAGDGQVRLSGVLRVRGNVMQQERSTGDRLKTHAIAGRRTLL